MDYLYGRVEGATFETSTPLRKAFRRHLMKVAKALHDIEWVDSGDYGEGDEGEAIRVCLGDGAVFAAVVEDAKAVMAALQSELARVK